MLAALLHDITSSAFGHSVQYVIHESGFEHEAVDHMFTPDGQTAGFSYQDASLEPIFFGNPKHLHTLLDAASSQSIVDLVAGQGSYGRLISGDMDLDNIDNVFRLAYHVGVTRDTVTPRQLARSMWIERDELMVQGQSIPLIERWQTVRKRLYEFLLLNPDEFSAKCMLEQALRHSAQQQAFLWHDVDFELIQKLAAPSSGVRVLASRLMVGNLYGCLGIYATTDIECHTRLAQSKERYQLETALSDALRATRVAPLRTAVARLHTIRDVAKTQRRVAAKTRDGMHVSVGTDSRRVFIGIFLENKHLSIDALSPRLVAEPGVQHAVMRALSKAVGPTQPLDLYSEGTASLD